MSAGGFFNSGATANITATANVGFTFVNFTGAATSTSNPLSLLIDAPKSITANFSANTVNVTVNSIPAGRSFTSSGLGCPGGGVTPQLLAWTPGANCLVTFNSPQSGGVGTQFTFARWEDNSTSPTRAITAPAAPATLTATFDTQYQLTTAAGTGGSVSAGGFFNSGATASITATPSAGYSFLNFTGAANSISNPLGLLMDAPKSVSANFTLSAPPLLTATIASKVDGPAANERIWTVQVTNTGAGAALNPRVASVQILAGAPAVNLGLVSLGSTVYPAALPVTTLNAGQSTTLPIRILFPATTPATRLQIRINLISDSGYTNSITLSNVTR